jgi:ubiquitin carboxyl-terminal hydrolase L3
MPFSDIYEAHRKKENEALSGSPPKVPESLFFMKQYIQNSCGTMALIHSVNLKAFVAISREFHCFLFQVLNNMQSVELKDGSVIKSFYEKAKGLSPEERGKLLAEDTAFINVHQDLAAEGQTEAPASDAVINNHFIAFVNIGNELFELDGRKNFPISHGETKEDSFLSDAAKVCKEFITRDPKEVNFTMMAFSKAD